MRRVLVVIASVVLSVFSTAVLGYISMAMPLGPWIAPTIVLIAVLLFGAYRKNGNVRFDVAFTTLSASIGGILATAVGFSIPAIYFIDPLLFGEWLKSPVLFSCIVGSLAGVAGLLGLFLADVFESKFIEQEKLSFPVGELVHKMISTQGNVKKSLELLTGFMGTIAICFLQDGFGSVSGILPSGIIIVPALTVGMVSLPLITLPLSPLVWSIGFVSGAMVALPLLIGALTKIFIIAPLNTTFFTSLESMDFLLAFCSGMVLVGLVFSFAKFPKTIMNTWKHASSGTSSGYSKLFPEVSPFARVVGMLTLVSCVALLYWWKFPVSSQVYLLVFTIIWTHEILYQAGKLGLARLGAFATFVMVPAMLLFRLDAIQLVLIAAFVEVCGGVAVDCMFGRKLAYLAELPKNKVRAFQMLGLLVSVLSIGIIVWLFVTHLGIGSAELSAVKARNRYLLLNAHHFNYYVLAIGALFGLLLSFTKINASFVLGGILMPFDISLGLIAGGVLSLLSKDRERWFPIWSGAFAAQSVWILFRALLG